MGFTNRTTVSEPNRHLLARLTQRPGPITPAVVRHTVISLAYMMAETDGASARHTIALAIDALASATDADARADAFAAATNILAPIW